jgi:hypothetical protein
VVCMEERRRVVLLPCKHMVLCEGCAEACLGGKQEGECPVCRVAVAHHFTVYL